MRQSDPPTLGSSLVRQPEPTSTRVKALSTHQQKRRGAQDSASVTSTTKLFLFSGISLTKWRIGSERIAAGIRTFADQFLIDDDSSSATDSHAVEPELDSSLSSEIQHEAITEVVRQETVESEVSDNGTLVLNGSIVGISNLDLGLEPTPPGGDGSLADLEVFDLQKLSFLPLQPGTDLFQVPRLENGQVLPIINVTSDLGQGEDEQNQSALSSSSTMGAG